jgi:hypothetical protein
MCALRSLFPIRHITDEFAHNSVRSKAFSFLTYYPSAFYVRLIRCTLHIAMQFFWADQHRVKDAVRRCVSDLTTYASHKVTSKLAESCLCCKYQDFAWQRFSAFSTDMTELCIIRRYLALEYWHLIVSPHDRFNMAAYTLHVICLCTCYAYCLADPHTQRCCSLYSFGRARSQARILSCSSGSWVYGKCHIMMTYSSNSLTQWP